MSRNSVSFANTPGSVFRGLLNAAIDTIRSNFSGSGRDASPIIGQLNHDTDTDLLELFGINGWVALNPFFHGQCRLVSASGTSVKLIPCNGNRIIIGGRVYTIPSAGVTLTSSGMGDSTYLIYAYWDGSAIQLEFSMTAHATDTATGVEIKSGNASRTLVGMVYVNAGNINNVASWFNRKRDKIVCTDNANRSFSSTSAVQVGFYFLNFLSWGDEDLEAGFTGGASIAAAGVCRLGLGIDATGYNTGIQTCFSVSSDVHRNSLGLSGPITPSEGFHTLYLSGQTSASTVTVYGASPDTPQLWAAVNN